MNRSQFKNLFLALAIICVWGSEFSFADEINRDRGGGADRPPRYEPRPGPSPRPEPRPSPRPEPRPTPRPEPRPTPRPEPRPTPRPEPRPTPRPEPRPTPRPEPRPTPRPEPRPTPRPRPPRPRPPYPRPPYPRPPRPRPRPPIPSPIQYSIVIDINRTLSNYERIDLADYFSLYQYAGYQVDSVEVSSSVYGQPMELSFLADRSVEDSAYAREGYSTVVLYPRSLVVLRTNTNELEIMARGNGEVQIDRVVLRVRRY